MLSALLYIILVILWHSIDSSKYSQNDTKIFAAWWTSSAIKNHHLFLKYSTEGWLIYFHELVHNLICPSVLYLASMVSVFKNPNVWMIASKNTLKFTQDKNISYPEPVIRFLAEINNLALRKFMIHNHVQYHMHSTWFIWRILIRVHLYTRYLCTVFYYSPPPHYQVLVQCFNTPPPIPFF